MAFGSELLAEIQQTYFVTREAQLVATFLLSLGLLSVAAGSTRLGEWVSERRSYHAGEAIQMLSLAIAVLLWALSLTVVWHISYLIYLALDAIVVDRGDAIRVVVTAAVLTAGYLFIRFVNRSIDTLAETETITDHQGEAAYHVIDIGIFLLATAIVLSLWGFDLTQAFLGAGLASAVVGLAARDTLAAIISGFVLLFSRPFRVGDWIEVNGRSGIVQDVTIVNTKVQTFSDENALIPNDEITNNQLINRSENDRLRLEFEVGVDYETDVERALSICEEALSSVDDVAEVPCPEVMCSRFGDSSIVLECRFWIEDPSKHRSWQARTAAILAVKSAFDREGISIPYPQRVHATRDELDVGTSETDTKTEGIGATKGSGE